MIEISSSQTITEAALMRSPSPGVDAHVCSRRQQDIAQTLPSKRTTTTSRPYRLSHPLLPRPLHLRHKILIPKHLPPSPRFLPHHSLRQRPPRAKLLKHTIQFPPRHRPSTLPRRRRRMQKRVPQLFYINLSAIVDIEGGECGGELVVPREVGEESGEAVEVGGEGEFGGGGGGEIGR